jgi:hypothetical protein
MGGQSHDGSSEWKETVFILLILECHFLLTNCGNKSKETVYVKVNF